MSGNRGMDLARLQSGAEALSGAAFAGPDGDADGRQDVRRGRRDQ